MAPESRMLYFLLAEQQSSDAQHGPGIKLRTNLTKTSIDIIDL